MFFLFQLSNLFYKGYLFISSLLILGIDFIYKFSMIPSELFKTVPIPYEKFGVHPRVCCPDNNTLLQDCPATEPDCGSPAQSEEYLENYEYSGDDYEFSGEEDADFFDYISTPTVPLSYSF